MGVRLKSMILKRIGKAFLVAIGTIALLVTAITGGMVLVRDYPSIFFGLIIVGLVTVVTLLAYVIMYDEG